MATCAWSSGWLFEIGVTGFAVADPSHSGRHDGACRDPSKNALATSPETLPEWLAPADLIVCGMASRRPVLERSDLEAALSMCSARPLVVLDIEIPLDVEASVRTLTRCGRSTSSTCAPSAAQTGQLSRSCWGSKQLKPTAQWGPHRPGDRSACQRHLALAVHDWRAGQRGQYRGPPRAAPDRRYSGGPTPPAGHCVQPWIGVTTCCQSA
jgi:hypothetical protein